MRLTYNKYITKGVNCYHLSTMKTIDQAIGGKIMRTEVNCIGQHGQGMSPEEKASLEEEEGRLMIIGRQFKSLKQEEIRRTRGPKRNKNKGQDQ